MGVVPILEIRKSWFGGLVIRDKNSQSKKRSKISLSLDYPILEEIRKDAETQGISINASINTILTKYAIFYRYSEEHESIVILDSIVPDYLDMIDEKEFLKLLNQFAIEIMPAIFRQNDILMSLDNVIKYCFQNIALWAGMYTSFRHFKDSSQKLHLVFEHKYGAKWSRIIGDSFCYFIETMLSYPTKLQILQNSVIIKVETE